MEKRIRYEIWELVESQPISAILNESNARILVQRGNLSGYISQKKAEADLERLASQCAEWSPKGCDIIIISVTKYLY